MIRIVSLFSLLMALFGCGYNSGRGNDFSSSTVSIPYIKGDDHGFLTNELIRAFAERSSFRYQHFSSDYQLVGEIVEVTNNNIGYMRVQQEHGEMKKNIMPTEARETVLLRVSLRETRSEKVVWGPFEINADIDYDFINQDSREDLSFRDVYGETRSVLSFSLGQLEPSGSASDAAMHPLYRDLAKKVVDAVCAKL